MQQPAQQGGLRVAAAPAAAQDTAGTPATVAATLPEGATTYAAGRLVRAPLGSGAATPTLGGVQRSMIPLPVGDLRPPGGWAERTT
ncbi:hypothetical protein [Streptomyces sp. NPDC002573]|uniref:hypothetical protein n=1 Tax=Streptomyces sp. NPDC002573 TaxID=3364651 RepID=UPI0036A2CF07